MPMLNAVVLAGGRSSRMGRDKALLAAGGQTLLARALDVLRRAGAQRLLLSGRSRADLPRDCADVTVVPDLLPHSGPPGGLYSSLEWLRRHDGLDGSPLLAIPVDMPMLEAEVLRRLIVGLGDARAAHFQDEVFPCVFRASEALHDYLRYLFADGSEPGGKRSMKHLFRFAEAREVSVQGLPDKMFLNLNHPEDWEDFIAGFSGESRID